MPVVLQTQALKVHGTALNVEANAVKAPNGTTKVTISTPVAARFYVGPAPEASFVSKVLAALSGNPTAGKTFTVMATTFTFVASGSGSTQIVIGANLSATLVNLVIKLNSTLGSGFQVDNLDPSIPGAFSIVNNNIVGPNGDVSLFVFNPTGGPMVVPASGQTGYASNGGGTYVAAGGNVTLDCEEGDGVATLSAGTGSDPASGAGATASFQGA